MISDGRDDPRAFPRHPSRGPGPRHAVWELTLGCDLSCVHCGSRAGERRPEELSIERALGVVDELAEAGVAEVTLIGGEFYLREGWQRVASALTRHGLVVGVTTGGKGLDDRVVADLVDAGVSLVSLSIDGLEATHDALRGERGAFAAACEAARRVAASPMQLATNTQINRLSMPELVALAELLHELGSTAWQVQLTVPMGRAADRAELLLQPDDLLELFPLLAWIKRERLEPRGISLFPGNNVGYYGPYEVALRYGGEGGTRFAGCIAGVAGLGIESDGKLKGCPSLPSEGYTGGSLAERSLADLLTTRPITHLGARSRADLHGYCASCEHGDVCLGGCTWTSHTLLGRPGDNPYCIHRQLDFERRGLRERLVRADTAPGLPFDHARFTLVVERAEEAPVEASILGVPLPAVVALRTDARAALTRDERRRRLRVV